MVSRLLYVVRSPEMLDLYATPVFALGMGVFSYAVLTLAAKQYRLRGGP